MKHNIRFFHTPYKSLWAGSRSGTEFLIVKEDNGEYCIKALSSNGRGFSMNGLSSFALPKDIINQAFSGNWKSIFPSDGRLFSNSDGLTEFNVSDVNTRLWPHMLRRMIIACENEQNIQEILAEFSPSNRIAAGIAINYERAYGLRILVIRKRTEKKNTGDFEAFMPMEFDTKSLRGILSDSKNFMRSKIS